MDRVEQKEHKRQKQAESRSLHGSSPGRRRGGSPRHSNEYPWLSGASAASGGSHSSGPERLLDFAPASGEDVPLLEGHHGPRSPSDRSPLTAQLANERSATLPSDDQGRPQSSSRPPPLAHFEVERNADSTQHSADTTATAATATAERSERCGQRCQRNMKEYGPIVGGTLGMVGGVSGAVGGAALGAHFGFRSGQQSRSPQEAGQNQTQAGNQTQPLSTTTGKMPAPNGSAPALFAANQAKAQGQL